jgi:type VI secretion system protein ImpG
VNREFLDLYNTELQLLKEHGKEFAEAYPEIAERLGGLLAERTDPMIGGLLEGAAFLAARVQLKLKHEFPEFTNNLLEQLVPNYLAPAPSVMIVQALPNYGNPALREGLRVARGAYLDAAYRDGSRQMSCRFKLTSDISIWPFEVQAAEYLTSPAALQALKIPITTEVLGGLRLSLRHRFAETPALEALDPGADAKPDFWFSGCNISSLPIHLLGADADCDALYEQIHSRRAGLYFRFLRDGEPVVVRADGVGVKQIGFEDDDALLDNADRVFTGFDLLREYFIFPQKFMGFRLDGLKSVVSALRSRNVEIIMTFREVNTRLAAAVRPSMFALYAEPAINHFEMSMDRVPVAPNQHEFHIVPDRSRALDFEAHKISRVFAHRRGGQDQIPVQPLYAPTSEQSATESQLGYTVRRLPRRRTQRERDSARRSEYVGTELFISLIDPHQSSPADRIAELSVRAICSNRHNPEHLPSGPNGAEIRFLDNSEIVLTCVAGPTKPREPIISQLRSSSEVASTGTVAWRLINLLSLNHLGLSERGAGANAKALRELLTIFACLPDQATERRLRGVMSVASSPVVRRLQRRDGAAVARGTEIRVTLDEQAFEGRGLFLFGAVLDRFFSEYAGFNHFTQTVIVTSERGEVIRWPARTGLRRSL